MLLYGAWIPQEVARSAGGSELLLEASALLGGGTAPPLPTAACLPAC